MKELFCWKHDYHILSETREESIAQQAYKQGLNITRVKDINPFERKLVQTLKCIKCGKIKRFVTTI